MSTCSTEMSVAHHVACCAQEEQRERWLDYICLHGIQVPDAGCQAAVDESIKLLKNARVCNVFVVSMYYTLHYQSQQP